MNTTMSNPGRPSDVPIAIRPKRSASNQFEPTAPRTLIDPAVHRPRDFDDDGLFIPTTISEHLLERTYLDDVVRPLVRALVKARMTYGPLSQPGNEHSQIYADLDRLRGELEKSTSRTRHAEQERDDLARRLDLAGMPEPTYRDQDPRDRPDLRAEAGPVEQHSHLSRLSAANPSPAYGLKRPLYGDSELSRNDIDRRNDTGTPVSHAEGSRMLNSVTADQSIDQVRHTNSPAKAPFELSAPSNGYNGSATSHHRPYPEMPSEQERSARYGPRIHLTGAAMSEHDHHPSYVYADGRDRWATSAPAPAPPQRPSIARYSEHMGYSSSGSSSYVPTSASSERSPLPGLPTYSTTPSSGQSGTPYHAAHQYEHDMDADSERARKVAKTRPSDPLSLRPPSPLRPGRGFASPSHNYPITPVGDTSANPLRKLAATKNRTCSNCSAPHDAKFRRGPNGPGTLCDRCGSRFKKFKEQELNGHQTKREHSEGSTSALVSGKSAARARLSSTSSSSQSPMELPAAGNVATDARRDSQPPVPSTEPSSGSRGDESNTTSSRPDGAAEATNGKQAHPSARRAHSRSTEEAMEEQ